LEPPNASTGVLEEGVFDTRLSLVDNIATLVEKEKAVLQLQLEEKENALHKAQEALKEMKTRMERVVQSGGTNEHKPVVGASAVLTENALGTQHMHLLAHLQQDAPAHAASAAAVRRLELRGQPIQSAQLDTLTRRLPYLKSIVAIDLSFAGIDDACGAPNLLKQLLGVKSRLKALHLQNNELGTQSFQVLCSMLPINTRLQVLEIQNNRFGNEPKAGVALGNSLRNNKSLVHLGVSLSDVVPHASGKHGVTYVGNPAGLLASFAHPPHAFCSLGLRGALVTPRSIEAFTKYHSAIFKSLVTLDMSHALMGPEGCYHLCEAIATTRSCSLTALNVPYNRLGNDGAVSLGKLLERNRSITSVDARSNQIHGLGAAALSTSLQFATKRSFGTPIARIDLGHNPLDKAGAQALLRAVERCPSILSWGKHLNLPVGVKARLRKVLQENLLGDRADQCHDGDVAKFVRTINILGRPAHGGGP
jgi:Ran GTPase-activating protein (RanGAP) involved in mRNA processing and transport